MKMATQTLLKLLMMRNSLLRNVKYTVLKSFPRLDSNSLSFLQLIKAVKTMTGGATWSIIHFDFACTTNFPFLFLMAPVGKYMR